LSLEVFGKIRFFSFQGVDRLDHYNQGDSERIVLLPQHWGVFGPVPLYNRLNGAQALSHIISILGLGVNSSMENSNLDNPECCRRSFGASLKDTAARLLADPTIAPRYIHNERMEICKGCDRFDANKQTCDLCGCYMPVKTCLANMKCPQDLWTEYRK